MTTTKKVLTITIAIVLAIVLASFGAYKIGQKNTEQTTIVKYEPEQTTRDQVIKKAIPTAQNKGRDEDEMRANLKEYEVKTPFQYLHPSTNVRLALVQNEIVLSGKIENSAKLATYKDVVFEVDFITKTGASIGTKKHIIYNTFAPTKTKIFAMEKIKIPSDISKFKIDKVKIRLVGATGY
jgi:hypothetical protein